MTKTLIALTHANVSATELVDQMSEAMADYAGCTSTADFPDGPSARAHLATSMVAAIEEYARFTGQQNEPARQVLRDLLSNAMHVCDILGYDFAEALDGAAYVYQDELSEFA